MINHFLLVTRIFILVFFSTVVKAQTGERTINWSPSPGSSGCNATITVRIKYGVFLDEPVYTAVAVVTKGSQISYNGKTYTAEQVGRDAYNSIMFNPVNIRAEIFILDDYKATVNFRNVSAIDIQGSPSWSEVFPGHDEEESKEIFRQGFNIRHIDVSGFSVNEASMHGVKVYVEKKERDDRDQVIIKEAQAALDSKSNDLQKIKDKLNEIPFSSAFRAERDDLLAEVDKKMREQVDAKQENKPGESQNQTGATDQKKTAEAKGKEEDKSEEDNQSESESTIIVDPDWIAFRNSSSYNPATSGTIVETQRYIAYKQDRAIQDLSNSATQAIMSMIESPSDRQARIYAERESAWETHRTNRYKEMYNIILKEAPLIYLNNSLAREVSFSAREDEFLSKKYSVNPIGGGSNINPYYESKYYRKIAWGSFRDNSYRSGSYYLPLKELEKKGGSIAIDAYKKIVPLFPYTPETYSFLKNCKKRPSGKNYETYFLMSDLSGSWLGRNMFVDDNGYQYSYIIENGEVALRKYTGTDKFLINTTTGKISDYSHTLSQEILENTNEIVTITENGQVFYSSLAGNEIVDKVIFHKRIRPLPFNEAVSQKSKLIKTALIIRKVLGKIAVIQVHKNLDNGEIIENNLYIFDPENPLLLRRIPVYLGKSGYVNMIVESSSPDELYLRCQVNGTVTYVTYKMSQEGKDQNNISALINKAYESKRMDDICALEQEMIDINGVDSRSLTYLQEYILMSVKLNAGYQAASEYASLKNREEIEFVHLVKNYEQRRGSLKPYVFSPVAKTKVSNKEPLKTAASEVEVKDKFPEFIGGNEALANFIYKNMKYPEDARQNRISGRVFVNFVVEKDGTVNEVTVSKGVHQSLDAEALRIVKSLPRFTPGMRDGRNDRYNMILPVTFSLTQGY